MTDPENNPVALIVSDDSKLDDAVMVGEVVDNRIHHTVIDGQEAWVRISTEPQLRSIEAVKNDGGGGWSVAVAVMALVRPEHAGYHELRQAIEDAIASVSGVTEVELEVNEVWWATGSPSGEDLARAVAHVLDQHVDHLRHHYNKLKPGAAFS